MVVAKKDIAEWVETIKQADSLKEVERLRIKYLGKKGVLTQALKSIKEAPADKRAKVGRELNQAQEQIEAQLNKRRRELQRQAVEQEAREYPIDLTAPGVGRELGWFHPVEQLQRQLIHIFWQLGFQVADGPEIESDWYNFEALNIPVDHPARDMQDTFYLENGAIPRTHTSSVQIRYMENHKPPIRIIAPGKVYRNEDEDALHVWSFHQLEGLVVDKGISMADLKGTLLYMIKSLAGEEADIRLRPNYFPYTEPSVEIDATCMICAGRDRDCKLCGGTGWVELLGAGMVHPQVLRNVGIDPAVYSGFAFGFGLERMASVLYQVDDLRLFWRPDLKFLKQFKG